MSIQIEMNGNCTLRQPVRNNYFYGKLLTKRDSILEQQYNQLHDRMHNLSRDGCGVVCGLKTEIVETTGIRVGQGIAIDPFGRQIIVSTDRVVENISALEGFPDAVSDGQTVFVCLEYDECPQEPVPALKSASSCEEICEHNHIQEGYKLTIKETAPPPVDLDCICLQRKTLFEDDDIKVERIAPRFIRPNHVARIHLTVTAKLSLTSLNLTVTETVDAGLSVIQGLAGSDMVFSLASLSAGDVAVQSYLVEAGANVAEVGFQAALDINGTPATEVENGFVIEISGDDIVDRYFTGQKSECPTCEKSDCIYLAALTLSAVGDGFEIAGQPALFPLRQYIFNGLLLYNLARCTQEALDSHIADKTNPHEVTAAQVGALNSVNNVPGDSAANIDLVAGPNITITPDDSANTITISASAATATIDPATTVTSVGPTQVVGTSENYAREDHVHDLADEVITGSKIKTDTFTSSDGSLNIAKSGEIINMTVAQVGTSRIFAGLVEVTLTQGLVNPVMVKVEELQEGEPFAVMLAPLFPAEFPVIKAPPASPGVQFIFGSMQELNRIFIAHVQNKPYNKTFEIHGFAPELVNLPRVTITVWIIAGAQPVEMQVATRFRDLRGRLLDFITNNPQITAAKLTRELGVERSVLDAELEKMVAENVIVRDGRGRFSIS